MSIRRYSLSFLIACASIAVGRAASAPAKPTPEDITFEGSFDYLHDSGVIVAVPDDRGNPVLTSSGARLEAGRIAYDRRTRAIAADGGVKVDYDRLRLLSDAVNYRADIRRLDTGRVRFGYPPVAAEAASVSMVSTGKVRTDTSSVAVERVKIYFNEPDAGVISVAARKVTFSSETNVMRAEGVVFRIGAVPVMYLPSYEQEGLELPPVDPEVQVGGGRRHGPFLRTTTFYTANPRWQPGLLLDGYAKSGVLVGPALRYDTAKVRGDDPAPYNLMKGDLRAGFIRDGGERGEDTYGRPIDGDRYFVEWRHKQTIDDAVEVTNSLHWWSDTFAARDLRPDFFKDNQSPDNFVEVMYPTRDYYASVFVRHDPNGFEDVNQRLPEVRFDLNPREIADWRLYRRGYASFAYLREEASPQLPILPGTADPVLATPRFDAYYGLTRPLNPDSSFGITPVAGVRSTTWFDAINGDAVYSRLAAQIGFDAHLLATGRWDVADTVWEIDGLRHKLRPVLQYRYLPGVTDGAGRIPLIDRRSFLAAPPPIDLASRRDTDEMHERQILRVGLENLFQTRHAEYGSRNLVEYNLYQDFRDSDAAADRTLSDTYSQLVLRPAEWLDFTLYNRVDPYSGDFHETTTATSFHDGDRWRLTVGTQLVSDVINVDQYYLAWEYKVNSLYTLLAHWRYDADADLLTDQQYGVRQQLGHSWSVEYSVGYRRNANQDSGTRVSIALRLVTF